MRKQLSLIKKQNWFFCIVVMMILFSTNLASQTNWHPYFGLHASMDGGGYYVGPSAQIGIDYSVKKKLTLSAYLHYFGNSFNDIYTDGTFEKGRYRSTILAILVQRNLFKKCKGFYIGGGLAIQHNSEIYTSSFGDDDNTHRTIAILAFRTGYCFSFKSNALCFELNATGPHQSEIQNPPYNPEIVTEILTQLSLGARFVF